MEVESSDIHKVEPKIYEIGYLLVPTTVPESVADEANKIIMAVEKAGGTLIASGNPELKDLAYTVSRELDRKRKHFDRAYFGWVKFELEPVAVDSLNKSLTANESIIRFLTIITTRNVLPMREIKRRIVTRPVREGGKSLTSTIDLDKEIDALIAETAN